jgi:O-antigen/teichoic acid export membrane protein
VGTRGATIALVCALMPLAGRTAYTYLAGVILVETVLVVGLTLALIRRNLLGPACFDRAFFRAGVIYGLPLVVYELAFAILASADRFLVRHYLGADALGLYSVANTLAQNANELLVMPLGLAILPIYMRIWNTEGAERTTAFLTTTLDLFLLAAAGLFAIVAAAAHPLVVLLASAKYAGVERLIPMLLGGLLIYATYIFVAAGLLIHKKTLQMAGYLLVAVAVNIALNCLLLPYWGLTGSAVATLLSYALCILLLACASRRLMPLHLTFRSLSVYAGTALLAWFAGSRIAMNSPFPDLLARCTVTLCIYFAGLYLLDQRVRGSSRQVAQWAGARI